MTGNEFDVIVMGGGVGGVAAERKLASASLSAALVVLVLSGTAP